MLNFRISPDFQTQRSRDAAAAAAAEMGKPADLVYMARARALRERRKRRAFGVLAILAAPFLAFKAQWAASQLPSGAPAEPQLASASPPAASLPHIVTRRGPAGAKIARDGIDFTATSATEAAPAGPEAAKRPLTTPAKPAVRKKKAGLTR